MSRYLCCYIIEEDNQLIKKTEILTSKEKNAVKGELDVLKQLSEKYNLPRYYVDRDEENPVKGVLYVRPKREYCPSDLCELDEERWEREEYGGYNIYS